MLRAFWFRTSRAFSYSAILSLSIIPAGHLGGSGSGRGSSKVEGCWRGRCRGGAAGAAGTGATKDAGSSTQPGAARGAASGPYCFFLPLVWTSLYPMCLRRHLFYLSSLPLGRHRSLSGGSRRRRDGGGDQPAIIGGGRAAPPYLVLERPALGGPAVHDGLDLLRHCGVLTGVPAPPE